MFGDDDFVIFQFCCVFVGFEQVFFYGDEVVYGRQFVLYGVFFYINENIIVFLESLQYFYIFVVIVVVFDDIYVVVLVKFFNIGQWGFIEINEFNNIQQFFVNI